MFSKKFTKGYAKTTQEPDRCPKRSLGQDIIGHPYKWTPISSSNIETNASDSPTCFHSPSEELTPMTAPWPFTQWGLDIMGPFPNGRFICRFGIPRVVVSDNGKQFDNPRFRQFSKELGIHNHYSSPGHP
uniref:Integrase catalytic domain-containing protein n=1 Tax=Fagus sylvatica TaxID=28930 RepID=A0A2N9F0R5_FAGSY